MGPTLGWCACKRRSAPNRPSMAWLPPTAERKSENRNPKSEGILKLKIKNRKRPSSIVWSFLLLPSDFGFRISDFGLRWLKPEETRLQRGECDTLQAAVGEELYDGLFAVRALPATCPDQFISLRYADEDGQEHEIGLVRDLAEWPVYHRSLLEQALAR